MAKSGSFKSNTGGYINIIVEWSSTQNLNENYTDVTSRTYLEYYNIYDGGSYCYSKINDKLIEYTGPTINEPSNTYHKTLIKTHTERVYHDSDGKKQCLIEAYYHYGGWYGSVYVEYMIASQTVTLDPIPPLGSKLGTINPFIIESGVSVPATKNVANYYDVLQISLKVDNNNYSIKNIEDYISSTIDFTEDLTNIYGDMPNNSAEFIFELLTYTNPLKTTQVGTTSSKTVIGTISAEGRSPTVSDFTYRAENTYLLTNDYSKLIQGYSDVIFNTITASANKGASISRYFVFSGTDQVEGINFPLTLEHAKSGDLKVVVEDSRGNQTILSKVVSIINYDKPTIKNDAKGLRVNSIGALVNFSFGGTFTNINFGSVPNEIICTYKYREFGTTNWLDGTSLVEITKSDNNWYFAGQLKGDKLVEGFTAEKSFEILLLLADTLLIELSEYLTTFQFTIASGEPHIAFGTNGISLRGLYDETKGGAIQIKGIPLVEFEEVPDLPE